MDAHDMAVVWTVLNKIALGNTEYDACLYASHYIGMNMADVQDILENAKNTTFYVDTVK